jgi:hypothetical protein
MTSYVLLNITQMQGQDEHFREIINLTIETPVVYFRQPTQGEVIQQYQYQVIWDHLPDIQYVNLFLHHESFESPHVIAYNMYNEGQFDWTLDRDEFNERSDFWFELQWHQGYLPAQQRKLCDSGRFHVFVKPPSVMITSPDASIHELKPGENITVSWIADPPHNHTNVYLMMGTDVNNGEVVKSLGLDILGNITSCNWTVDVEMDSPFYFIRVEERWGMVSANTHHINIPRAAVHVFALDANNDSRQLFHGAEVYLGDKVKVFWHYNGPSSTFDLTMRGYDRRMHSINSNIPNSTREYEFELPKELRVKHLYAVHVRAKDFKYGTVSGNSEMLRVIAPGALGVRSKAAITMVVIVGLAAVAFLVGFYCCYYRKFRANQYVKY